MFATLRPDAVLDDIRALTPALMRARGIRLILTDLDNTLTDYRADRPDPHVANWLNELGAAGIALYVLSNNKAERVRAFCEPLQIPYIARSGKPRPDALLAAMHVLDCKPAETLMVGDQIFTDVRAAKRAGLRAVLVKPYRMGFWHRLRRIGEAPFILSGKDKSL